MTDPARSALIGSDVRRVASLCLAACRRRYADGSYMIRLSGHIDPGDELKFSEIADTIPATEKVEVVLTSNGGSINGLEIGRIIRERKFETIAYIHCASMCASI